MKRKKNWISLFLIIFIISSISIPVNAKETVTYYGFNNTPIFTGTMEEAQTAVYISSYYRAAGSAINNDGTVSHYTYKYGNDYIEFDFEKKKMTWIDGSKWDITYTGSLDRHYLSSSGLVYFTDDVIRTFCPEFAATQSLIPAGAPANFSSTLSKFKEQKFKRLGISRDSNTVTNTGSGVESFSTFNAIDYATRYPDVKQALGTDKQALWNHYFNFGKQEGRTALFNDLSFGGNGMESFESFNAVDYANRYPDVKQALGTDKQALWNHYVNFGKQEGRTALFN